MSRVTNEQTKANKNIPRPQLFSTEQKNTSEIHYGRALGQTAFTVTQPADSPRERWFRDGQSAGLASVATQSIKTLQLRSKILSQNTDTRAHKSSLLEYPLIKEPSTASESMKIKMSAELNRSAKVNNAMMGANISIGTIWVLRVSHVFLVASGIKEVNWKACMHLRSNKTAPIRSPSVCPLLGSGVKPSVNKTASASLLTLNSIGRGCTSFLHCRNASFKGKSNSNESDNGKRAYTDVLKSHAGTLVPPCPRADLPRTSTFLWACLPPLVPGRHLPTTDLVPRSNLSSDLLLFPEPYPPSCRWPPR